MAWLKFFNKTVFNYFKSLVSKLLLSVTLTKRRRFLSIFTLCLLIFVLVGHNARALGDNPVSWFVYGTLGAAAEAVIWFIGKLLILVVDVMISVAQYNGFANSQPVRDGWLVIRDLCNMFFILVLLIIAFATVLRVSKYSISSLFKKVIIAAIFINFSRLICFLIIDFAQVVMLTFVAGFQGIGAGNLTEMLGIKQLVSMTGSSSDMNAITILGSYFLAVVYALVALVVMIGMLFMLVSRIVFLWIYIILSPAAYLMTALPGGSGYSGRWWKDFTNNVVVGPVLAFFIWLSVSTLGNVSGTDPNADFKARIGASSDSIKDESGGSFPPVVGVTQAGTPDHLYRLAISLAFLVAGLITAKSTGAAAGVGVGWAYKRVTGGASWLKKVAMKPVNKTKEAVISGAKTTAKAGLASTIGIAKTADVAFARKVTGNENRQGFVAQGITLAKSAMPKEAWERFSSGRYNQSRARYEATKSGKHVENGVTYKKQADGTFMSDDKRVWRDSKGSAIKAMGASGQAFYENYYGSPRKRDRIEAIESARDKEVKAAREKYKNLSQNELKAMAINATGAKEREAFVLAAYDKGPLFDTDFARFAERAVSASPKATKDLRELRMKNEAFQNLYNNNLSGDVDGFKNDAKKGKIKLSEQAINEKTDAGDLAKWLPHYMDAIGMERFRAEISKIDKEDTPEKSAKIAEALHVAADRSLESSFRDKVEERVKVLTTDQKDASGRIIKAKISEKDAREMINNNINGEKDRIFKAAVEADRSGFNMRAENVKLSGKLDAMAFVNRNPQLGPDGKPLPGQEPRVNPVLLQKFAQTASAKQFLDIDQADHTLNNRNLQGEQLDHEDFSNILVSNLSAEKIKTMDRVDANPQTASKLKEMMVKHHHPQSGAVVFNSRTETPVDLDKVEKNKVVQNVLRSVGVTNPDISSNDVGLQNKLREAAEADMKTKNNDKASKVEIDKAAETVKQKESDYKKTEEALNNLSTAAKTATDHLNNLVSNPLKEIPNPVSPADMAANERYKQYEKELQIARLNQEKAQREMIATQAQLEVQKAQVKTAKQDLENIKKTKANPVNYFETTKDGKLKDSAKVIWQSFINPSIDALDSNGLKTGAKISRAQQLNPDIPSIVEVVKQPGQNI